MKKTIRFLAFMFTCFAFLANQPKAFASHEVGMAADLTYVNVAPNIFVVQYKYYRDCSATLPPAATVPLVYKAPGCNVGSSVPMQKGSTVLGQPYCSAPGCLPGKLNYNEITYNRTIVLPALCSNWKLSVANEGRMGGNMVVNLNSSLYSEATINTIVSQTNSSPAYNNVPVVFAFQNTNTNFHHNFTDIDGDSIAFSLADPLNDTNMPAAFLPGYSAANPLGTGNLFTLDLATGMISFRSSAPGNSTFAARIVATEYKYINGIPTIVGSTSRDLLFVILTPLPPVNLNVYFTSNGQPLKQVYEVSPLERVCIPIRVTIYGANRVLRIASNATQAIQGSSFTILPSTSDTVQNAIFCWTPRPQDVRTTPYQFQITARNNDCPIPSFSTYTVQIKVVKKKRVSDPGPIEVISPQPPALRISAPNVITPNNDGKNDAFVIQGLSENTELQIIDRNKKVVKVFKKYQNNWNAEGLKNGTYFYILKNHETGEVLKGTVEVIR